MAYTCIRIRRVVANVVSPCIYWGQRGKRALRVRVTVASRKPPCRDISLQCHAPSGLADSYWLVSLPWQPRVHVADAVLVSNHRLLPGAQTSSTKTRSLLSPVAPLSLSDCGHCSAHAVPARDCHRGVIPSGELKIDIRPGTGPTRKEKNPTAIILQKHPLQGGSCLI